MATATKIPTTGTGTGTTAPEGMIPLRARSIVPLEDTPAGKAYSATLVDFDQGKASGTGQSLGGGIAVGFITVTDPAKVEYLKQGKPVWLGFNDDWTPGENTS